MRHIYILHFIIRRKKVCLNIQSMSSCSNKYIAILAYCKVVYHVTYSFPYTLKVDQLIIGIIE
jgi:hypothetical protein